MREQMTELNGSRALAFVQEHAVPRPAGTAAEEAAAEAVIRALSAIAMETEADRIAREPFTFRQETVQSAKLVVPGEGDASAIILAAGYCAPATLCDKLGKRAPHLHEHISAGQGISSSSLRDIRIAQGREAPAPCPTGISGIRTGSVRVSSAQGELLFVGDGDAIRLSKAAGRIVMTGCPVREALYRQIEAAGALAFISVYGAPTDDAEAADPRSVRLPGITECRIPGVAIHYREALRLLESGAREVRVGLRTKVEKRVSSNIVAWIDGTEGMKRPETADAAAGRPEKDGPEKGGHEVSGALGGSSCNAGEAGEFLALAAHYDSVPQGPGAYDNLSAVAILLELYRYFSCHRPRRSLCFVFFGAEEPGLLGSRHYVCRHETELARCRFAMNIDLAGQRIGQDVLGVTGEKEAAEYLYSVMREAGIGVMMKNTVWSGDSNSFAWKGVPSMTLDRDGFGMHTRFDTAKLISAAALYEQSRLMAVLTENLANREHFPFARSVPESMREELQREFESSPT